MADLGAFTKGSPPDAESRESDGTGSAESDDTESRESDDTESRESDDTESREAGTDSDGATVGGDGQVSMEDYL